MRKYVSERTPVLAWFNASDRSWRAKVEGIVTSWCRDGIGVAIAAGIEREIPVAYISVALEILDASTFEYVDETELSAELPIGSGLCINLPSGESLAIAEIRRPSR